MTQPTKTLGQPPLFWIGSVLVIVAILFAIIRLAPLAGRNGGTAATGLILGLVVAVLVIGGFALSISGRTRHVANRLPGAIAVAIVVGSDLALATAQLAELTGQKAVRLRPSSWLAVLIESQRSEISHVEQRSQS